MVSLGSNRAAVLVIALTLSLASVGVVSGAGPAASTFFSPHGSCGSDRIILTPAAPNHRDSIQITASGIWCNACTPKYQSHERNGNVITLYGHSVESDPGIACAQVLTSWSFTVEINPLSAGAYTIQAIVDQRLLSYLSLRIDESRTFLPLLFN
jgi:hypothetical protein